MMPNATLDDRLNDVKEGLVREFSAIVPTQTILEAARECADHYRGARIADFVPLFVQLEVRRRLLEMTQLVASA